MNEISQAREGLAGTHVLRLFDHLLASRVVHRCPIVFDHTGASISVPRERLHRIQISPRFELAKKKRIYTVPARAHTTQHSASGEKKLFRKRGEKEGVFLIPSHILYDHMETKRVAENQDPVECRETLNVNHLLLLFFTPLLLCSFSTSFFASSSGLVFFLLQREKETRMWERKATGNQD